MLKTIAILCVLGICCSIHAKGPVTGDECWDAMIATIAGPNYFDTSSATPSSEADPDESMCTDTFLNWTNSPDIWFTFTPSVNDIYNFSTCNIKSYDTSMVLYTGSCSTLTQIACNGDSSTGSNDCQSYYSEIEISLYAGTQYFIRIGGFEGASGWGKLTVSAGSGGGSGNIWYVDIDAPTGGGGTSWSSAFRKIEDALDIAVNTDQIWIAEGIYTPTSEVTIGDPRSVSFFVRQAIGIYGGFDGTEVVLEDRDLSSHHTILTGDLDGDDVPGGNTSENAYHVISSQNVTAGAITIDGFWIHGGNADISTEKFGGGIFIDSSTTVPINVNYCRIKKNNAVYGGAIVVNSTSSLTLLKVKIELNSAGEAGGGLYVAGDTVINSSVITGNTSVLGFGGAIATGGDLSILNTTISQNSARITGGIATVGAATEIHNSILWGNTSAYGSSAQIGRDNTTVTATYSCIEGLPDDVTGNNNISRNPHFANPLGDDGEEGTGDEEFQLFQGSPCIDAGDNTLVTTVLDLDGILRFIDDPWTTDTGNNPTGAPIADMGPFELRPATSQEDGVRIWSGLNSNLFHDVKNWNPNDIPSYFDTALFNSYGSTYISTSEKTVVGSLVSSTGNVKINLNGYVIRFESAIDPVRIGRTNEVASLGFENGQIIMQGDLRISGAGNEFGINDDAFLNANNIIIEESAILNFSGEINANVINSGGIIDLGSQFIANAILNGNFNEVDPSRDPVLPNEIIFDVQGTTQGVSYDHLEIVHSADLTNVTIQLRYNWIPEVNETYDFISAGSGITGTPSIMTYSGLPSEYACEWATDAGLLGGGDATVVTTGPILFDGGVTTVISTTPNDLIVADFDGVNGPDIAMSMPGVGAPATVEILLNNGMSGGVWQGFAAPISVSTGSSAEDLEIGDLDDNNSIDIVVTNHDDDTVTILLNDGSANFTTTTLSTGVGTGPICLAIADLDTSDGLNQVDLAIGCESSTPVGVQIYTNSTTLASRGTVFNLTSTWASPVPSSIDPTDVNDTKDLDLIILSNDGNSVTVKRGDGAGNTVDFMAFPFGLPGGSSPVGASIGLLNEDTNEDYITVNNGGNSLSILTGNGLNLTNPSPVSIGDEPLSIAATDFDNDGDSDLVVSELDSSGVRQLSIIRNDSSGSIVILGIGDPVGNGSDPVFATTGDFDEDGLTDILSVIDLTPTMSANSPAISVYTNITAISCPPDVDGSGTVDVDDLLALIAGWGGADPALDINGSGNVDVDDLLILIGAWGPC